MAVRAPGSPLQNRVRPDGVIEAVNARGTMYGNRGGCFHRDDGTHRTRTWATSQWLVCVLAFKGRRRPLLRPGQFTELFFLDEAVALAAGHRPCFECRRARAELFATLWADVAALDRPLSARAMDATLAGQRLAQGGQGFRADVSALPDGAMIAWHRRFWLVRAGAIAPWSPSGYGAFETAPLGLVDVLTPAITVNILARGYPVTLHRSGAWTFAAGQANLPDG